MRLRTAVTAGFPFRHVNYGAVKVCGTVNLCKRLHLKPGPIYVTSRYYRLPSLIHSTTNPATTTYPTIRTIRFSSSDKEQRPESNTFRTVLAVIVAVSSISLILEILAPKRAHPLSGFQVEGKTGDKPAHLEQWVIVGFDLSGSHVEMFTEIAALLALQACQEAEVIEKADEGLVVLPKQGSKRTLNCTSAIVSAGTLQSHSGEYGEFLKHGCIMRGNKGQVERLKRRLRINDMMEGDDGCLFLLNPLGGVVGCYPLREPAELIAEEISSVVR